LNLDEMSKLWTTSQAQFRVSAAYQASVVLIDPRPLRPSPLPVLKRGDEDEGPSLEATLPPVLEGIAYQDLGNRGPAFPALSLVPGAPSIITINGRRLRRTGLQVVIERPQRNRSGALRERTIVSVPPEPESTDLQLRVRLDAETADWVCGKLALSVAYTGHGKSQRSNRLEFCVPPRLIKAGGALASRTVMENGRRQLVLQCDPPLRDMHEAWLLLTGQSGRPSPPPIAVNRASSQLTDRTPVFDVHDVPSGAYIVRLRVDMVDSILMVSDATGTQIEFDQEQRVVL
jgi:hypothetical protein